MKKCTRCNEIKNLSDFGFRKASRDGLWGHCKSCVYIQAKNWKLNNPERIINLRVFN